MASRPTGNERTDAKNSLGLSGLAPVDPSVSKNLGYGAGNFQEKTMQIAAMPGEIVRATHSGTVGSVEKLTSTFSIDVYATNGALSREIINKTAFTRYTLLGTADVVLGQKVAAGQQLGTVAFRRQVIPFVGNAVGSGEESLLHYRVFKNGTGTPASEAFPDSEAGIAIVKAANPDGIAPNTDEQIRKPPAEGGTNSTPLAPVDTPASTADVPVSGPGSPNPPYDSNAQVGFAEQKNQVYEHDFLVFVNGVDITRFVVGQLSISLVDKDGWNEANVTLNNATDNFVITLDNLGINAEGKPKFRSSDIAGEDKYSERAKEAIMKYKGDSERNPWIDVETMSIVEAGYSQGLLKANVTGFEQGSVGSETTRIAETSRQEIGQRTVGGKVETPQLDRRWQLGYQSTVFHKNDPIRIFRKNPLRKVDQWMPAFCGYLENVSYTTNYVSGLSNVKLTCYDIRALIQKMRIQTTAVTAVTNPRAIFLGPPGTSDSLFTDLLDPSITAHPLAGRRFEDVMEFLITGTATQDPKLSKRFRDSGFSRGVGDFTVGDKIYFKPGDTATGEQPDPLEHWHALCLFGMDGKTVNRGNIEPSQKTGKAKEILGAPMNRRWLTEAEARAIGAATTHDGEWAPHSMFVHFLLPADGTGAKNLLDFDAFNANGNQLEFRGKLDILQDFANRIDYQFWVTPMGDFVIEFPQYDFFPRDYGEYHTVFRVNKHLQSDNIQDEAGDMTTAVIAHGRISPIKGTNPPEQYQPKAVVVAPLMMIRYGVVEHELTLPFIPDPNSLKRIAQIEFQKKLSESNRMDMQFDYRPFITPNRPMENFERQRMALTTAVQNNLELFKLASTSVSTRYVRRALFRADGSIGYTVITGGTSMPISYRQIYKSSGEAIGAGLPNAGSGQAVRISVTPTGGIGASTGTGTSTTDTLVTAGSGNYIVVAAINAAVGGVFTDEMRGRFTALAQQLSGFTETARNNTTNGFGLFQLSPNVRGDNTAAGAFGIGDSIDIEEQIGAARDYFGGLAEKYKGDLDAVVAEFSLGVEKIKNLDLVTEFQEGFGKVNKELGAKYEELSQAVTSGFNKLFPGQIDPVDMEVAIASEETKEAITTAETEGAIPSDRGYQSTQGVIAYDNSHEQAQSTEQSTTETQAQEATT